MEEMKETRLFNNLTSEEMQELKELSEHCQDKQFLDMLSDAETEELIQRFMDALPEKERKESEKILSNEKLLPLTGDKVIKNIFDPDIHPDRLEYLLESVYGDREFKVKGSIKNEFVKRSIYTKGMITDIQSHVNDRDISNVEMQVLAQNFICQRMEIYAAEYIISQYTREKSKNPSNQKEAIDAGNIGDVYMCALMKESPKLFKGNPEFLHRTKTVTDSGIEIPDISHIVYVELDKAKRLYLNKGYTQKNKEACFLMAFIADVNLPQVRREAERIPFYNSILGDIKTMGYDRKEMLGMLADKYADMAMDMYKIQWFEEGIEKGIEKGKEEEKFNSVDAMVKAGVAKSAEACKIIGLDYETYIKHKQLQETENRKSPVKEQTVARRPAKRR